MKLVRDTYGQGSLYLIGSIRTKTLETGYHWTKPMLRSIDVHCGLTLSGDNAGFLFSVKFFSFFFEFSIRDTRRWNWKANRFYTDEEERKEALQSAAGFRARLVDLHGDEEE